MFNSVRKTRAIPSELTTQNLQYLPSLLFWPIINNSDQPVQRSVLRFWDSVMLIVFKWHFRWLLLLKTLSTLPELYEHVTAQAISLTLQRMWSSQCYFSKVLKCHLPIYYPPLFLRSVFTICRSKFWLGKRSCCLGGSLAMIKCFHLFHNFLTINDHACIEAIFLIF